MLSFMATGMRLLTRTQSASLISQKSAEEREGTHGSSHDAVTSRTHCGWRAYYRHGGTGPGHATHRDTRSRRAAAAADSNDQYARLSGNRACRSQASGSGPAKRQESASAAGDAGYDPMGLVRQRPAACAPGQFRRHHRDGNDDAQSQSGGPGHHHRTNQEIAYGFPGSRAAYIDGTYLHRRGAAG